MNNEAGSFVHDFLLSIIVLVEDLKSNVIFFQICKVGEMAMIIHIHNLAKFG
jgi:hypothetical protein